MACKCRKIAYFVGLSAIVAIIAIVLQQQNLDQYPDVGKNTVSLFKNFVLNIIIFI